VTNVASRLVDRRVGDRHHDEDIDTRSAAPYIAISGPATVSYRSNGRVVGTTIPQFSVSAGDTDVAALRSSQLERSAGRHQGGLLMISSRVTPMRAANGFLLLEVLVTIVVLAFGILGLVNLQARMQNAEMESYQRSQALVLLQDMAARVNAHRTVAATYITATPVGTADSEPTDCSGIALGTAARDLCEWSNALEGRAELKGTAAIGTLIGGRGCVEQVVGAVPLQFRVTVTWQGLHETVAPAFGCATGAYGTETYRRAIAKVVTIGNLTP